MSMTRCIPCRGSGRLMGGGMITVDCDHCDGSGKIPEIKDDINYLSIKQTESYQKAKARLISKNENLSDEEAEKLLDEAFEKEKPKIKKKIKNAKKEENRHT